MYEGVVFVKIAVCDDDSQVLLRVLSKLAAYREQRQADLPVRALRMLWICLRPWNAKIMTFCFWMY